MIEWFDIKKKFPKYSDWYLCVLSNDKLKIVRTLFFSVQNGFDYTEPFGQFKFLVTHWAKLPKPPRKYD